MSPFQKSMASNVVSVKVTVYLTSLTVLCWHVDHRVSRRWVVPTSGRRSRKVWRAQRGRPCTPLSPSPKVEKNWAEPVHSRPSHRSGETTEHPQVSKISPSKWEPLWRVIHVVSVECGDHEEGDRCRWRRALQSSLSAEEEKRFLLQISWQRLPSVRGQWVSDGWI